jgi:hypothetical protein
MNDKSKYYQAMKKSNGQLDDIDLGNLIGLDENGTRKIISTLLSEYKIEFKPNGLSDYRIR